MSYCRNFRIYNDTDRDQNYKKIVIEKKEPAVNKEIKKSEEPVIEEEEEPTISQFSIDLVNSLVNKGLL